MVVLPLVEIEFGFSEVFTGFFFHSVFPDLINVSLGFIAFITPPKKNHHHQQQQQKTHKKNPTPTTNQTKTNKLKQKKKLHQKT